MKKTQTILHIYNGGKGKILKEDLHLKYDLLEDELFRVLDDLKSDGYIEYTSDSYVITESGLNELIAGEERRKKQSMMKCKPHLDKLHKAGIHGDEALLCLWLRDGMWHNIKPEYMTYSQIEKAVKKYNDSKYSPKFEVKVEHQHIIDKGSSWETTKYKLSYEMRWKVNSILGEDKVWDTNPLCGDDGGVILEITENMKGIDLVCLLGALRASGKLVENEVSKGLGFLAKHYSDIINDDLKNKFQSRIYDCLQNATLASCRNREQLEKFIRSLYKQKKRQETYSSLALNIYDSLIQ